MEEKIKEIISPNVNEINSYLKELLKDNSDVVFREFNVSGKKCLLVCIDGISDKNLTNNFVMETLLDNNSLVNLSEKQLFDILTTSDMKKSSNLRDSIIDLLSGETLLFIEGKSECYIIATRSWPNRGVGEPSGESVIRGSRDGFTETIRSNTALIRRRVRDTRLRIESIKLILLLFI